MGGILGLLYPFIYLIDMSKLDLNLNKIRFNPKGYRLNLGVSPDRDWKIIFFFTLLLALLMIAISIFTFIEADKGEIFVIEKDPETSSPTLNIKELKASIDYYQNKKSNFDKIKNTVTPYPDPSI